MAPTPPLAQPQTPIAARPSTSDQTVMRVTNNKDGFPAPWKAAFGALVIANPKSISSWNPNDQLSTGIEYAGLIYRKSGRYFFTEPKSGEEGHVDVWASLPDVPAASQNQIAGDYHTHGGPNPVFDGEQFSGSTLEQRASVQDAGGGKVKIVPHLSTPGLSKGGDIQESKDDLVNRKANILDTATYTSFLGTPKGRFGLYIPSRDLEFYFDPDPRLLP